VYKVGTIRKIKKNERITGAHKCDCGFADWLVGDDSLTCEHCGSAVELEEPVVEYVEDGPTCDCGFGDYLVGTEIAKCMNCGKVVDRKEVME